MQLLLVLFVIPVALTRWIPGPTHGPLQSRYLYFVSLPWTVTVALALGQVVRRSGRGALVGAAVVLVLLAAGHAVAARTDGFEYSPRARRGHLALVERLRQRIVPRQGPVYDAPLPVNLAWNLDTRVSGVLSVLAPGNTVLYTNGRTPETIAPYLGDPLLEPLLAAPFEGETMSPLEVVAPGERPLSARRSGGTAGVLQV